jgi:hypothetical protein
MLSVVSVRVRVIHICEYLNVRELEHEFAQLLLVIVYDALCE